MRRKKRTSAKACANPDNGRAMHAPTTLRKKAIAHDAAVPVGARIARPRFMPNLLFAQ